MEKQEREIDVQIAATLTVPKAAILEFGASGHLTGFELNGNRYGFYITIEENETKDLTGEEMEALGFGLDYKVADLRTRIKGI